MRICLAPVLEAPGKIIGVLALGYDIQQHERPWST